jgi:DNA sulfur modification protein DndD
LRIALLYCSRSHLFWLFHILKHAIAKISQIDLLESIEKNLTEVVKGLRKEAVKNTPDLKEKEEEIVKLEDRKQENAEAQAKVLEQIEIAKQEIQEIKGRTTDLAEIGELQKRRDELKDELKGKNNLHDQKIQEKKDLLFEYYPIIALSRAIKRSIQIIQEKEAKGELPPDIDKILLQKIIDKEINCICGRDVGENEISHLNLLKQQMSLSSELSYKLSNLKAPLHLLEDKIDKYSKLCSEITLEIQALDKEISKKEGEQKSIESKIVGYDAEMIQELFKQQQQWESTEHFNLEKLGGLKAQEKVIESSLKEANQILEKGMKKKAQINKQAQLVEFGDKAVNIVTKSKNIVQNDIRKKIEEETKNNFFSLIWKQDTYTDVLIDENYIVRLIHRTGFDSLGTAAASERALLTLAFILALHKVSGYESPILVDTPVSRISDEQRQKFARRFSNIPQNKQVILLFTPSEYSEEISSFFDKKASNIFRAKLSSDESEISLEV